MGLSERRMRGTEPHLLRNVFWVKGKIYRFSLAALSPHEVGGHVRTRASRERRRHYSMQVRHLVGTLHLRGEDSYQDSRWANKGHGDNLLTYGFFIKGQKNYGSVLSGGIGIAIISEKFSYLILVKLFNIEIFSTSLFDIELNFHSLFVIYIHSII